MKKIRIAVLCFVLLFTFMNRSFAELPANRIALGVQLGAKFKDVKNVFGVPDRVTMEEIKSEAYGNFVESKFIYGNNSIVVSFYNEDAWRIESNSDNGWRTPDGVTVGMPLQDVYDRLGKEDIKSPAENGETLYWYNHDTNSQENRGNLYVFVKGGRVSRIVIAYQ
ncbi:MAG: hypothetical protein IJ056_08050 [Acidaminococcaceae bacterium]|nr:hypothetical protein [Acidaminococcaceae bacterium]